MNKEFESIKQGIKGAIDMADSPQLGRIQFSQRDYSDMSKAIKVGSEANHKDENDICYITIPEDMRKELNWEMEDKIRFDETEICTDDGEYNSLVLVNESLEERMKNGE